MTFSSAANGNSKVKYRTEYASATGVEYLSFPMWEGSHRFQQLRGTSFFADGHRRSGTVVLVARDAKRYQGTMLNEWSDREPDPPEVAPELLWGVFGLLVLIGLVAGAFLAS
jgi:hypothetical protein